MELNKIKAVLFDYNDTLVKTKRVVFQALQSLARDAYSFELSEGILEKHWGKPMHELFKGLFGKVDSIESSIEKFDSVRKAFPQEAYSGVKIMLSILHKKNLKLGIITATNRKYLKEGLIKFDIPIDYFDYLQVTEDSDFHKPDPRVFSDIISDLSKYDIYEENIVYVGDSILDEQAATDAGLNFVALVDKTTSADNFKTKFQISEIAQLSSLIK